MQTEIPQMIGQICNNYKIFLLILCWLLCNGGQIRTIKVWTEGVASVNYWSSIRYGVESFSKHVSRPHVLGSAGCISAQDYSYENRVIFQCTSRLCPHHQLVEGSSKLWVASKGLHSSSLWIIVRKKSVVIVTIFTTLTRY